MIKKWIIIITIIAGLIVGCYFENRYINHTFENMVASLQTYKEMLEATEEEINLPQNLNYLEALHSKFHEDEKVLKTLIWHTGLKDVEISLSRIITYTEESDFTEAMAETNGLIDYCKHYSLDFKISLENIF